MLDSGGYSGTDWSTTEVIDMWLAICNQDTTPHWQVVAGWRKSYELTAEHLSAVKSYRANLAQAWPPEKNAAWVTTWACAFLPEAPSSSASRVIE